MLRMCQRRTNPPPHLLSLQVLRLHKGDDTGLHLPQFLQRGLTTTAYSSAEMLEKLTFQSIVSSFGLSSLTNVFNSCRFWLLPSAGGGGSNTQSCVFPLLQSWRLSKISTRLCCFCRFLHASCCVADSPKLARLLGSVRLGLVWFGSRGYCKHPWLEAGARLWSFQSDVCSSQLLVPSPPPPPCNTDDALTHPTVTARIF